MTILLTIGALGAATFFTISAINAISRITALDTHPPGPWGIASWKSTRKRPLDAHERRWHTAMTAAKDNDPRWHDFVAGLDRLELAAGVAPDSAPPESFDHRWIEGRLAQLESLISDYAPGETTR